MRRGLELLHCALHDPLATKRLPRFTSEEKLTKPTRSVTRKS
jgi:hypothetical protein